MKTKKGVIQLFKKLEKQYPFHSSFIILQKVCEETKLSKLDKERAFCELVDPEDYEMTVEDYKTSREDKEFRKQYPTRESYNEEIVQSLISQLSVS